MPLNAKIGLKKDLRFPANLYKGHMGKICDNKNKSNMKSSIFYREINMCWRYCLSLVASRLTPDKAASD